MRKNRVSKPYIFTMKSVGKGYEPRSSKVLDSAQKVSGFQTLHKGFVGCRPLWSGRARGTKASAEIGEGPSQICATVKRFTTGSSYREMYSGAPRACMIPCKDERCNDYPDTLYRMDLHLQPSPMMAVV